MRLLLLPELLLMLRMMVDYLYLLVLVVLRLYVGGNGGYMK